MQVLALGFHVQIYLNAHVAFLHGSHFEGEGQSNAQSRQVNFTTGEFACRITDGCSKTKWGPQSGFSTFSFDLVL